MQPGHRQALLVLLSALLVGCGGGGPNATAPTTVPPADQRTTATLERRMVSLGQVMDAGTYKAVFPVTNTGQHDLYIIELKPECSCATASYHPSVIKPGERGEVEVTIKPSSLSGQQNVQVNLVWSAEPTVETLTIGMGVVPVVRAGPTVLNFGRIARGDGASRIVQFASQDPTMELETVTASNPNVTCRLLNEEQAAEFNLSPPREGYFVRAVEVSVGSGHPWGEMASNIIAQARVRLDAESEPIVHEVRVPAFGSIFGEIEASSTTVDIGWLRPGQPFDATIDLRRPSGDAFQILSTRVDRVPGGRIEYEAIEDGGHPGFRVHVRGTAPNTPQRIEGLVAIITDVTSEGVLALRVSGGVSTGQ